MLKFGENFGESALLSRFDERRIPSMSGDVFAVSGQRIGRLSELTSEFSVNSDRNGLQRVDLRR